MFGGKQSREKPKLNLIYVTIGIYYTCHYVTSNCNRSNNHRNCNCILYFLILLYYTYLKYWFDCIHVRGTELYQHVLESVG
jgi:hypothetical protein